MLIGTKLFTSVEEVANIFHEINKEVLTDSCRGRNREIEKGASLSLSQERNFREGVGGWKREETLRDGEEKWSGVSCLFD